MQLSDSIWGTEIHLLTRFAIYLVINRNAKPLPCFVRWCSYADMCFLWYTYTQAYIVNVSIASKSQRKLIDSPQRTWLFYRYLSTSGNNSFEICCSFYGNRKHYSVQLPVCHIQLTSRLLPVPILLCAKERRTARVDENLSMLRIWRWLYKYKQW